MNKSNEVVLEDLNLDEIHATYSDEVGSFCILSSLQLCKEMFVIVDWNLDERWLIK